MPDRAARETGHVVRRASDGPLPGLWLTGDLWLGYQSPSWEPRISPKGLNLALTQMPSG